MPSLGGICGAAIGGVVGAMVWAIVSYITASPIGYVAWAVCVLVGYGMTAGNRIRGGIAAGVVTAVVSALAVLGGRYTVARITTQKWLEDTALHLTSADARVHLAGEIYREIYGRTKKPRRAEDGAAMFPRRVIAERDRRWSSMGEYERDACLADARLAVMREGEGAQGAMTSQLFVQSFGRWNLLWFGLGVTSAFVMAARGSGAPRSDFEPMTVGAAGSLPVQPAAGGRGRAGAGRAGGPAPELTNYGIFGRLGSIDGATALAPAAEGLRRAA